MSAIAFLYSCRFSFPRGGWERGCKDHLFLLPLSPSCETLTLWLTRTPVTLITRLFVFEIDTGYENVSNPRFFLVSWNFRSDQTAYVRPKLLFVGSLAVKGQGKLYTTRKSFASFWQMYVAGRTVSWELLLLPISWIIIIFLFEVFVYR